MEPRLQRFFERYQRVFTSGLLGDLDIKDAVSLYASDFIAATPAGVVSGRNDEHLEQMMAKGYERYRATGLKDMRLRAVRMSPIDPHHCVAHVGWTATYAREDHRDTPIDFEVHYLVQILDSEPKVFGWISGDEQAVLKEHGIVQDPRVNGTDIS